MQCHCCYYLAMHVVRVSVHVHSTDLFCSIYSMQLNVTGFRSVKSQLSKKFLRDYRPLSTVAHLRMFEHNKQFTYRFSFEADIVGNHILFTRGSLCINKKVIWYMAWHKPAIVFSMMQWQTPMVAPWCLHKVGEHLLKTFANAFCKWQWCSFVKNSIDVQRYLTQDSSPSPIYIHSIQNVFKHRQ